MAVELLLMNNVEHLGKIGDTVRVADGYARNYLIPRGYALRTTAGAVRRLEAKKTDLEEHYESEKLGAASLAERIAEHSISIPVQADENEKLYGSVTAFQIEESLLEMNIEIDRKRIILAEPIRNLGVYSVDIHLHPEVIATVKVWVVKA
jgi:large subunit ribosomal protein L9